MQKIIDRIDSIKLENTHDSGTIERLLENHPLSLFPQIITTERPVKLTSDISEGRIAILLDGGPSRKKNTPRSLFFFPNKCIFHLIMLLIAVYFCSMQVFIHT